MANIWEIAVMVGTGAAYLASGLLVLFTLYVVARVATLGVMQSIHKFNSRGPQRKDRE